MKEREISLVDLIFYILLRWRAIIVAMVIGAVLMGGLSYVNSYRTSKAQAAKVEAAVQQLEQEMQGSITDNGEVQSGGNQISKEQLELQLTATQLNNVKNAWAYELSLQDRVAYQEQSILMQVDPNNVPKAEITFHISSLTLDKTYNIVAVYEDLIGSGELLKMIAENLGVDIAILSEAIYLETESEKYDSNTDSVRVAVIHYDAEVCGNIAQLIVDYVEDKCVELKRTVGAHQVTVLSQSIVSVVDTDLMDYQNKYVKATTEMESTLAKYKDNFSEAEWQYFDLLLNGEVTGLGAEEEAEESLVDIISTGVTVYPGVSMMYVILGAILAAFVYVFVIFIRYILNATIRANDNLQDLYEIPQLGFISQDNKTKKILGFVDTIIISLRDCNKRKFTREEALNLAAVAVKMAAGKGALNTVYLIGCDLKEQTLEVCNQIKNTLSKDNIKVEILNNVLYNAQAMSELEDAKGVVLVEKSEATLYTEIAQEIDLLKRHDINVLGGIIVE